MRRLRRCRRTDCGTADSTYAATDQGSLTAAGKTTDSSASGASY